MGWPDVPSTGCHDTTHVCEVALPAISQPLSLPVGGVLSCVPVMSAGVERLAYELDSGGYVLRLSPSGGYGLAWDGGCPSRQVAAGEEIPVWTYTRIEAFTTDALPISLVVTRNGHLYVGDVSLEFGCPCQIGH